MGPTRENPVSDPLAKLHLDNHLYINKEEREREIKRERERARQRETERETDTETETEKRYAVCVLCILCKV